MTLFGDPTIWLPIAFATLLGLSVLLYVILDGFDLGVGLLLPLGAAAEQDRMVAAIGPFWDANETWLVLGVGILLVAFPAAHGMILTALYIPVALMLVGLILRGVAFEFRAKVSGARKPLWNALFSIGSGMTALTQGFMLGLYITGLQYTVVSVLFGLLTAMCLAAGYAFIGATWLVLKAEGDLQKKAIHWCQVGLVGATIGLAAVSLASPLASARIFEKWFSVPQIIWLAPLPILCAGLIVVLWFGLHHLPRSDDKWSWAPFAAALTLFAIAFAGLAYSFFPYIVQDRLTIYAAASAPESLFIILVGTLLVLPVILGYTAFSYFFVFRGKAVELHYD